MKISTEEWAMKRAKELVVERLPSFDKIALGMNGKAVLEVFAAYIAKHEPEPVDPLLEMAREAAARAFEGAGLAKGDTTAERYRAGLDAAFPGSIDIVLEAALEALRMAKEQGLPE